MKESDTMLQNAVNILKFSKAMPHEILNFFVPIINQTFYLGFGFTFLGTHLELELKTTF